MEVVKDLQHHFESCQRRQHVLITETVVIPKLPTIHSTQHWLLWLSKKHMELDLWNAECWKLETTTSFFLVSVFFMFFLPCFLTSCKCMGSSQEGNLDTVVCVPEVIAFFRSSLWRLSKAKPSHRPTLSHLEQTYDLLCRDAFDGVRSAWWSTPDPAGQRAEQESTWHGRRK